MASLLIKFKFLPTHCGVAQSPTLSPRTSPLLHLRRRKTTLRMLLTRNRRRPFPDNNYNYSSPRTNTLKDLFVSSPPPYHGTDAKVINQTLAPVSKVVDPDIRPSGLNPGSPRPVRTGLRYKYLLRKTWRPVLAGIPE